MVMTQQETQQEKDVKAIFLGKEYPQRTKLQNAALHLYFTHLAEACTDAGLSLQTVLQNIRLDIPVTPVSVKENIWKPVQKAMLGKVSTTELDTVEISQIWEALNYALSTRLGIHVLFPSEEQTKAYLASFKK